MQGFILIKYHGDFCPDISVNKTTFNVYKQYYINDSLSLQSLNSWMGGCIHRAHIDNFDDGPFSSPVSRHLENSDQLETLNISNLELKTGDVQGWLRYSSMITP